MAFSDYDAPVRRGLSIRDKQILYRNAKGRCQNPAHGKPIAFDEMQIGHKTAFARGGKTTLKNSVVLCYRCNKLQGTDSWITFLKKQGHEDPKTAHKHSMKLSLNTLSISQLKFLAKRHGIKVAGRIEENFFEARRLPATKDAYIKKLAGKITARDLATLPKASSKKRKPKKRQTSDSLW